MAGQGNKSSHRIFISHEGQNVIRLGQALPQGTFEQQRELFRVNLLGTMRGVSWDGRNALPRGRRARALLGYLCLRGSEAVTRQHVAGLLWDRVPDQQASTSLRQALRELTSAMSTAGIEVIESSRETLRLDLSRCWIDCQALLSTTFWASGRPSVEVPSLRIGELMEGVDGLSVSFDHWLLSERSRFGSRLRETIEAALSGTSTAPPETRAATARRVVAFDPTHEGASRTLMQALAELGERGQALGEYKRCRAALKASLDVEPSAETRALRDAVRTFTPPARLAEPRHPDDRSPAAGSPSGPRLRVEVRPFEAQSDGSFSMAFFMSQEIAAGLARFRWFDVIAPASAEKRAGLGAPTSRLSSPDVHYLVDGALISHEHDVIVNIRLLDVTAEPRPIWSDRFQVPESAMDKVNELIVGPVVARIDPAILFHEAREKRGRLGSADALIVQAIPLLYSMRRDRYEAAGELIEKALSVDPGNVNVLAWAAYWQVWHVGQGWATDPTHSFARAQELAVQAIRLDPENAEALGIYAHICAFLDKDFDSAVHYFERALQINPNLAFVWALSAPTCCYIGEPELALKRLDRYRELAPFDPLFPLWEYFYAMAYLFKGDYGMAASVARRAVKVNPDFVNGYKPLIAALGHLGRKDEAVAYVTKLLTLEPQFTVAAFGETYPFRHNGDRERYMLGLILAGAPEQ